MLAGLFVVFLVEAPDELFEDRAHAVVVERRPGGSTVLVENRLGRQVIVRSRNFSISAPIRSCSCSVGIWLWNLNFCRISLTFSENPSR